MAERRPKPGLRHLHHPGEGPEAPARPSTAQIAPHANELFGGPFSHRCWSLAEPTRRAGDENGSTAGENRIGAAIAANPAARADPGDFAAETLTASWSCGGQEGGLAHPCRITPWSRVGNPSRFVQQSRRRKKRLLISQSSRARILLTPNSVEFYRIRARVVLSN